MIDGNPAAGRRIAESGLYWRFGNSCFRGPRVFRFNAPYDQGNRSFPLINPRQQYLGERLADAVQKPPLIELRRGHHVTGVVRHETSAVVRVDAPEHECEINRPDSEVHPARVSRRGDETDHQSPMPPQQ